MRYKGTNFLPEILNGTTRWQRAWRMTERKAIMINYWKQHFPARYIDFEGVLKEIDKENVLCHDSLLKREVLGPVVEQIRLPASRRVRCASSPRMLARQRIAICWTFSQNRQDERAAGWWSKYEKSADYLMSQYNGRNLEEIKKQLAFARTEED